MKVEVASWAPVPNKLTVSVDVKQYFNNNNNNNQKQGRIREEQEESGTDRPTDKNGDMGRDDTRPLWARGLGGGNIH